MASSDEDDVELPTSTGLGALTLSASSGQQTRSASSSSSDAYSEDGSHLPAARKFSEAELTALLTEELDTGLRGTPAFFHGNG